MLDDQRLVGVVTRADLLFLVDSLPASRPVRDSDGGGLLGFLESLIGGASLLGVPERASEPAEAHEDDKDTPPSDLTANAFRSAVRAFKAASHDHRNASKREAELERQRQIKTLLDQRMSEAQWMGLLDQAKLAAQNGEQEFMMVRFPSDLCTDRGRKVNVAEQGWRRLFAAPPLRFTAAGKRSSSRGVSA